MSASDLERSIGKLEAGVCNLLKEVEEVTRLLLGDGQPGALDRITRMEAALQANKESTDEIREQINEITAHVNNKEIHPTKLKFDRKTIAGMIIGFSALYELLENQGEILQSSGFVLTSFLRWLGG